MLYDDAIAATVFLLIVLLAEGVRRLPNETLVIRRTGAGPWVLTRAWEIGKELRLVSWCLPVSVPIVQPPATAHANGESLERLLVRLEARTRRTRHAMVVLQVGGFLVVLVLAALPAVAFLRGTNDFLVLALVLLAASVLQASVAFSALVLAGSSRRQAFRRARQLVWPFAATRAAEVVQLQVADGIPRMAVAYAKLGEREFLRAVRPLVYDMLTHQIRDDDTGVIAALCKRVALEECVRNPPDGDEGQPYCPRCARLFRADREKCSECEAALLVNGRTVSDPVCER